MDENIDFSKAIEKVQEMLSDEQGQSQIENLLGMLTAPSEIDKSSNSSEVNVNSLQTLTSPENGIDLDIIMKIQKILRAMNSQSDNPKTTFLNSLKPFFSHERREKLEQVTKLLKISSVLKALKDHERGV